MHPIALVVIGHSHLIAGLVILFGPCHNRYAGMVLVKRHRKRLGIGLSLTTINGVVDSSVLGSAVDGHHLVLGIVTAARSNRRRSYAANSLNIQVNRSSSILVVATELVSTTHASIIPNSISIAGSAYGKIKTSGIITCCLILENLPYCLAIVCQSIIVSATAT